ncbi:MAG: hypothetical protein IKY79_03715 [Bacteroidales bacterium]|nr:hypothetical protein [Bacteroidales bacterium]
MKKTFMTMAGIAMLAAGIAFFASCEKDNNDNGLTTNVQPKISYTHVESSFLKLWWFKYIIKNEDGEDEIIWKCIEHHNPQGKLCAMGIVPYDFGTELVTFITDGATIITLHFNVKKISSETEKMFSNCLEKGFIEFEKDCFIKDPKLLDVIEEKYIPAGKYPIYLEEDNYVIEISK